MTGRIRAAVERALRAGFQISPGALEYLEGHHDPEHVLDSALRGFESNGTRPLVIDRSHLEAAAGHPSGSGARPTEAGVPGSRSESGRGFSIGGGTMTASTPPAAEAWVPLPPSQPLTSPIPSVSASTQPCAPSAAWEGVRLVSGAEAVTIRGKASDFRDYFRSRFEAISSILRARADVSGASTAFQVPDGIKWHKVKVIGMVSSKKEYRDGSVVVELEDEEGSVKVTFRGDEAVKKKAARLLVDEVVCVLGATRNGGTVIAEDVIWPDIPYRARQRTPAPPESGPGHVYAALTSDVHIGSKTFLEDDFDRFLGWLRGESDDARLKEMALHTKYLVIAGDLVDGVGIYPNQEDELDVQDVYEQYRIAAEYIATLPDRIRVIIIPGNHDACRPTLPTPPIYREYAARLYSMGNVMMLGDPSVVDINGSTFLVTHGRSLDDAIPFLPDCSFREPQRAMVELLKSRHIAPIYGEKTPLAPEPKDRLVIERVPDVFLAGHVHVEGVAEYRGVLVVNSGTWQSQTKYQLSSGIVPKPSVVPVVDLNAMRAYELNFT